MASFKTQKINDKKPELSRSLKIVRWIALWVLSIFSIGFIFVIGLRLLGGMPQQFIDRIESGTGMFETALNTVKNITAPTGEKKTNILLVGIGGKWHDGGELTDSILLASINGTKNTISMISIPRDLYIAYPGGYEGRINELYSFWKKQWAGIDYLKNKITEITGEKIDFYGVIDFTGFKKVVDILGGIEVDVPEDLVDREYPTINWDYTTFSVKKWLQTFDGDTALKYARSRHSTSDFSRSARQQLIIKAIKDKFMQLGFITDAGKIYDVIREIENHFETDLPNTTIFNLALTAKDIHNDRFVSVNLNNNCSSSALNCQPWSFLYNPNRDFFNGASVLLVEWLAGTKKEDKWIQTERFGRLVFNYPEYFINKDEITVINGTKQEWVGNLAGIQLRKLGFTLSRKKPIISSTGVLEKSLVRIYWDPETQIGINPESDTFKALDELVDVEIVATWSNLYVVDDGPKIEIILGKDYKEVFPFIRGTTYSFIGPSPEKPKKEDSTDSFVGTGKVIKPSTKNTDKTTTTPPSKETTQKSTQTIDEKKNTTSPTKQETNNTSVNTDTITSSIFENN